MRRSVSWRRVLMLATAMMVPAVAAGGIGIWTSRASEPPALNPGTERMRAEVWQEVLETVEPVRFTSGLPVNGHFGEWREPGVTLPYDGRSLQLQETTLPVCATGAVRWNCLDAARLGDDQIGDIGPAFLRAHLVEINRESVPLTLDRQARLPRIAAHELAAALDTTLQCERYGPGSFDVIVLGRPVFSPDNAYALVTVRQTNCNRPDHINGSERILYLRRDGEQWRPAHAGETHGFSLGSLDVPLIRS